LPPSAFIGLGFIIAAKNIVDEQLKQRQQAKKIDDVNTGSKRVRTTGQIS
jgi:electron transport complex protein RnfE